MIIESLNKYINPVLKEMSDKWTETVNTHIIPAIQDLAKVADRCFGGIAPLIKGLWDFLKPFVSWVVESVFDVVSQGVKDLWDTVMNILGDIMDTISEAGKVIEGVIDTVSGLLTEIGSVHGKEQEKLSEVWQESQKMQLTPFRI